jgi:hypothetical protein
MSALALGVRLGGWDDVEGLRLPVRQKACAQKKSPASRRDFSVLAQLGFGLATALALLIGFLALTVRILLLLSGLLAAALLLSGLLARGLVLLARLLIRVGHRDLPG